MASAWGFSWGDAWGDSWGALEVAVIAPVPNPPVDFVISAPYYMHQIQVYRTANDAAPKHTDADEAELLEMMKIYATATKARRMRV